MNLLVQGRNFRTLHASNRIRVVILNVKNYYSRGSANLRHLEFAERHCTQQPQFNLRPFMEHLPAGRNLELPALPGHGFPIVADDLGDVGIGNRAEQCDPAACPELS